MTNCTNEKLLKFSKKHFTYINQIFGDETIRQIITEIFGNNVNKHLKFMVEKTNADFEHSFHHVLFDKKKKNTICSVDNGFQNLNININDTLCQSYTLLTYFNKPINPSQKQRQMDMINMYREILSNERFIKELDGIIIKENNTLWIDYTSTKKKYVPMNKVKIIKKIKEVLDEWEDYGFYYFIGNGKCPKIKPLTKKSPPKSTRRTIRTRRIRRN